MGAQIKVTATDFEADPFVRQEFSGADCIDLGRQRFFWETSKVMTLLSKTFFEHAWRHYHASYWDRGNRLKELELQSSVAVINSLPLRKQLAQLLSLMSSSFLVYFGFLLAIWYQMFLLALGSCRLGGWILKGFIIIDFIVIIL